MAHRYSLTLLFLVNLGVCSLHAQNCPITVTAGPDKYICAPPTGPVQLEGDIDGNYLNFFWTPTTGMTGSTTLTPSVNVSTTTTYVLTARAVNLANNLITNGDFEQGNVGFTSDYLYNPGNLVPEGVYDIIDNPQNAHPGFAPCGDHTSGTGNMMVVNGSGTPNQNVWCQTISGINPNSQYVFSCWVATVVAASPARLQFEINGTTIGPIFNAPASTCVWQNFYTTWNSGANTTATICILNQNTGLGGNDFALDDLLFAPICTVKDTVKVNVVNITAKATPTVSTIPCEGSNITLSGAGSSTGADITYLWDTPNGNIVSGSTTLSPVVNAAGTYTLTVTYEKDGFVCTKTATVNVIESPNPISAWITPPQPLGCGVPTTTILGNSNQPGISAWQWTASGGGNIVSGANSKNCIVNKPGFYELVVTNTITGCTASAQVEVFAATNPPTSNATASGTITCITTSVPLNGTGSTTGANISYLWTTANGTITGSTTALNTAAGSGGTYILAVTNSSNGCIAYDTVTVASNKILPMLSAAVPQVLDCNTDTLTLSATFTPADAALLWTTVGGNIASGSTTATPNVTLAGVYTLAATNTANGCTATVSVTTTSSYTPPVATIAPADSITCQQSSVTLSGAGSSAGARFRYLWTASTGGNIVSGGNTLSPVVNAPATYTLLVTDTINACTTTASVQVVADQNIVLAVANAPDTLTCSVVTVTLNNNGSTNLQGVTYAWTTTDGKITAGANTPTPTVSGSGTYQLLVTNTANGCSATDLAVVAIDTVAPNISIAPTNIITCANPEQTIQATNLSLPGNFTYAWTADTTGHIVQGETTLTPTVNLPGVFTLVVRDLGTGCTATYTTAVGIANDVPIVTAASPGPLTCVAPAQNLIATVSPLGGNITYDWTTPNGGHFTGADTIAQPGIDAPGIYNLLITNQSNGCTATTSVVVAENKIPPPAEAGFGATLTCTSPVYNLDGNNGQTGSYIFLWSSPTGHFIGNPNAAQVMVDSAGLYHLLVTDPANGCTATDSVTVLANQIIPQLQISKPDTLTCAEKEISFTLTVSPAGFHTTQWITLDGHFTNGQNTVMPSVDEPGFYTLLVTNAVNGCTQSGSVMVAQDTASPKINIPAVNPVTCAFGTRDITAQNSSATGNFTYAWTATAGGNITSPVNALGITVDKGGTYNLLATNSLNGCTATASVMVAQNTTLPTAAAGIDDTLTCNLQSLVLTGSISNEPGLSTLWTAANGGNIQSGANTLTPTINKSGTYALLVTNPANGCTATDNVQIFNDNNTPQANAGTAATLTCTVLETSLNATASTGTNLSYQWTTTGTGNIKSGATTLQPVVDNPGIYILAVANSANGCITTSSVTVPENVVPPVTNAGTDATLTCATTSLSLNGTASGGTLTHHWVASNGGNIVSGSTSLMPVINRTGTYTLTTTNSANGCTASDMAQVGIDTLAPTFSIAPPVLLTCIQKTTLLTGAVQQPASGGFTAAWTTNDGHFVAGLNTLSTEADVPGTYFLEIKNTLNGCVKKLQVPVSQNIIPPIANAGQAANITCAVQQLGLNGAGSSAGVTFGYQWTAGPGGQILSGATTLTPTVNKGGTYTLQVTGSGNGCTSTSTVTVGTNLLPPVVVIALPQVLTCVKKSVPLDASASNSGPNFPLNWTVASGHLASGQNTLNPVVDQPGVYILTITNSQNGCTSSLQTTVSQNVASPGADAGPAVELHCNLLQAVLQGSSPAAGTMGYVWSAASGGNIASGSATAAPQVDAPGAYQLTVTDPANGCTSTDATIVTEVLPPTFKPTVWQPDCLDPTGAVDFGPVTSGKAPFQYSVDGGNTYRNSPNFDNLKISTYYLRVRDAYGCEADVTVDLQLPFTPTVTLPALTIIELGDSILLQPELNQPAANIVQWQWSPGEWLDCTDCPTPEAKPQRRIFYTLKIKDINGCSAEAKTEIRVNRRRNLYTPNIFSPNGDGENDRFMIFGKGAVEVRELRVFDRWGNQLYFDQHLPLNDQTKGWDGTFRGDPVNPAVFIWHAIIEFVDGAVESYSGDVTVER